MEDNVSRYYYELSEAKNERTLKRLFWFSGIIIVVLLIAVFTLAILLYKQSERVTKVLSETEFYEESIDVDSGNGRLNIIGRDGNISDAED